MDFALFETIRGFTALTTDSKYDDDPVDRLNRYWTGLVLVLFAIVLSAKQIVGEPLKCWTPAEFKDPWIQYTEDYCWVKNTYFVPQNQELGSTPEVRSQQEIGYYQWIPYVLVVQAFCYYLPAMVWRMFNWKCGLDLPSLMSRVSTKSDLPAVAQQLSSNFITRMHSERNDFFFQHSFLTCLYLITKLLYAVNSICQYLLLSSFFGRAVSSLFTVTRDLAVGVEWHESGHFPRVTFCDFSVRRLGNVNNYSIQCVLAINIFTEKVFVFAGFWMLLVAIVTVFNSLCWGAALLLPWRRLDFVQDRLSPSVDKYDAKNFANKCLRTDGLLIFHLIAANANSKATEYLIQTVFDQFHANDRPPSSKNVSDETGSSMAMQPLPEQASTLPLPSREAEVV